MRNIGWNNKVLCLNERLTCRHYNGRNINSQDMQCFQLKFKMVVIYNPCVNVHAGLLNKMDARNYVEHPVVIVVVGAYCCCNGDISF